MITGWNCNPPPATRPSASPTWTVRWRRNRQERQSQFYRDVLTGKIWAFKKPVLTLMTSAMAKLFSFDEYSTRILTGLNIVETHELQELEQVIPSLAEWNAYTMQPVSEREKRWAYLSQKHIEAMKRATG
jgi:hypothetical protein